MGGLGGAGVGRGRVHVDTAVRRRSSPIAPPPAPLNPACPGWLLLCLLMRAGLLYVDRVLYSSVVYPHNYGVCMGGWVGGMGWVGALEGLESWAVWRLRTHPTVSPHLHHALAHMKLLLIPYHPPFPLPAPCSCPCGCPAPVPAPSLRPPPAGFIPRTYCPDHDPLDVLVLMQVGVGVDV